MPDPALEDSEFCINILVDLALPASERGLDTCFSLLSSYFETSLAMLSDNGSLTGSKGMIKEAHFCKTNRSALNFKHKIRNKKYQNPLNNCGGYSIDYLIRLLLTFCN